MHLETLVFGVVPAIFFLSLLIAFCKAKAFWRALGTTLWLFPVLLVIGLLVVFGYCEANKAYWDYKVSNWCDKDGGVTIYEKVELTQEKYKEYGGVRGSIPVPSETSSHAKKYLFLSSTKNKTINKSNPEVYRWESIVYRKTDKKTLGKVVSYKRSGGDFPTIISHPSGFGCKDMSINLEVERKVFNIKGEIK